MSNWILITPIITFQFGGPEVSKFDLNCDDLDMLRGSYRHRHVESLFSQLLFSEVFYKFNSFDGGFIFVETETVDNPSQNYIVFTKSKYFAGFIKP